MAYETTTISEAARRASGQAVQRQVGLFCAAAMVIIVVSAAVHHDFGHAPAAVRFAAPDDIGRKATMPAPETFGSEPIRQNMAEPESGSHAPMPRTDDECQSCPIPAPLERLRWMILQQLPPQIVPKVRRIVARMSPPRTPPEGAFGMETALDQERRQRLLARATMSADTIAAASRQESSCGAQHTGPPVAVRLPLAAAVCCGANIASRFNREVGAAACGSSSV